MNTEYLQLGALGIIFIFAIKEFFAYMKARKGKNGTDCSKMVEQLELMNNNHLNSISKDIVSGSDRVVTAIREMHTDVSSRLGEIKGKLDKR